MRVLILITMMGLFAHPAGAHKPSDSYLKLEAQGDALRGQWDIALRDLEHAIGLDADGDGAITWGEVRANREAIVSYAFARLALSGCTIQPGALLADKHSDGGYAVLQFTAGCGAALPKELQLEYSLFADLDATHRGLVRAQMGAHTITGVLGPDRPSLVLRAEARSGFLDYLVEGVWHIWIGFDHILFLVSLLLPAVLAVARFAPAFWDVFKVVTAFTIAHSITLALAALGVVNLPSRLVESAIAFSVVLAALNNVWPVVHRGRWLVAFGFGLVHGFGFATVLAELGLPRENLVMALLGFNLGVELGQLAIVAVFLPAAFAMRDTWAYRRVVTIGGSAAIALVALGWLVERALDVKLY